MKPHTLFTLLLFLLLWDVGPVLAGTRQTRTRHGPREVYPLALRSRNEIRQASEVRHAATPQRGRPAPDLRPTPAHGAPRLAGPDLLSLLMSWQC